MTPRADRVAQVVIAQFDRLPPRRKPAVRDNGAHEWIPLSGVVAEHPDGALTCLALATGMKCLPAARLPDARGGALHDWHAEVLALRALNRLLLDECLRLSGGLAPAAGVVGWAPPRRADGSASPTPFRLRPGLRLHMYCSEAPCGDASMELVMAAQQDATPWDDDDAALPPAAAAAAAESPAHLPGRAYFSRLGVVRRKPARGDAPPAASKSCSDKLALKQCLSLLSSLAALFVDPRDAYLDSLVLPASQHSAAACERAFSAVGRMAAVAAAAAAAAEAWPGGYAFRPFAVETTAERFRFSREAVGARAESIAPCNLAAAWAATGLEESIVGGVLHGWKPSHPRAASRTSRRQMWALASTLAGDERVDVGDALDRPTYRELKAALPLAGRRTVKAEVRRTALAGWVANPEDSGFGRDVAA